jgi:1-acyl-sn-glycerol-3-phosphate acyltransferase
MNDYMIKNIIGRILAVWAIIWFVITMLLFYIPFTIMYYFIKEPQRTFTFIASSRIWMGIYLPMVGCPLRVKGKEHFKKGQNYIVLCNHNSLIDVPVSSPGIPGGNKTIAKIEMEKIPLFGMIYRMGSVLVDRKSETSRRESFAKMKAVLDMGLHMCIYPEGTRNKTDQPLKEFHDGAFKLAIETKKAIIPAVLFNTRNVLPANKKFFFWPNRLRMDFLNPVVIKDTHTIENLKQEVFEVMSNYYINNVR